MKDGGMRVVTIYKRNLDCKSLKSSSENYRRFSAERKSKDKRIASLKRGLTDCKKLIEADRPCKSKD